MRRNRLKISKGVLTSVGKVTTAEHSEMCRGRYAGDTGDISSRIAATGLDFFFFFMNFDRVSDCSEISFSLT